MVIIDASIVVSCYFKKEKFHKKAKEFLKKLIEEKKTILLPEIAFPEIASAIARGTGNPKYAIEFCREIRNLPNFIFVPVDQSISEISAEIASNYFLRGADSIYEPLLTNTMERLPLWIKNKKKESQKL